MFGGDWLETLLQNTRGELDALSPSSTVSHAAIAAIVILGLIEVCALALSRHGKARRRVWSDAVTAAALGLGGLIVGIALAALFAAEYALVQRLAPAAVTQFWHEHLVLGFCVAFVAWDSVGYLYHRIGHGTAVGWAAHRPHHTGQTFTLSLAWRQSWLPVHAVVLPLVAIGGWSFSTIVICAGISNLIQALQHTRLSLRYPAALVAVVMTPVQHRRHHLAGDQGQTSQGYNALDQGERTATAVNLGPVFTCWDRLAGTYVSTPVASDARFGVGDHETNPARIQAQGWKELAVAKTRNGRHAEA